MFKRLFLVGALVAGLAVPAVAVPTAEPAAAKPPHFSGPLDHRALQDGLDAVTDAGAPGAFAQVRGGWWPWSGASGVADLATERPMRPWLRHRVGSITKTFVATTLLQLIAEDRLRLDDPIGQWLPELPDSDLHEQVTVRMLLNHTSGIGNYTSALLTSPEDVERLAETDFTPWELVEIGLGLPRTGAPGDAFAYSNTNYILAGLVLEEVTGRDAATVIERRIIRRLGLWHTYFPGDQRRIRGPHASAYFAPLGEQDFSTYDMSWAWMAGELVSTTADLNRFFRALLSGWLLPPEQLDQMQTTVPMNPEVPEAGGYGLGLYQLTTPCGDAWGHDGGVVGQITVSLHTPDADRQATFAMNYSHYQQPGEPHPIDQAYSALLNQGLCPESEPRTLSTVPRLRLPGLPHLGDFTTS